MARVIRFDPKFQGGEPAWERYPRFDEIGSHIDAQAGKLFDSEASLARNRELYARLEKFERAAYLVGLRAGTGKLEGLPPLKDDRRDGPDTA